MGGEDGLADGVVAGSFDVVGEVDDDSALGDVGYHLGELAYGDVAAWVGDVVGLAALSVVEYGEEGADAVVDVAP